MTSDQHRLVILGSMDEFVSLVCRAQARGIYVIVCDGYADGSAKKIADKSFTIDVRDTEAIVRMCKEERADGIISSFSDLLAECLILIADKAGLKCYLRPQQIKYLRDKTLMKQMFAELDIPYPQSVRVHRETMAEDLKKIGFPCVIKPVNAYGSHGVYLLSDVDEVAEYFDDTALYSDADYILAEEYNDGFEFNMMNWIVDRTVKTLSIADREKSKEILHVTPHVSRIVYPSILTDRVLDEAHEIVGKVARYVGLENGPLCMQFFWSPEKGIQVCECAGRIFGYEHELLEYASGGLAVEDLLLDYVYDPDNIAYRLDGHSAMLKNCAAGLYFHAYEGKVGKIIGIPETDKTNCAIETLSYYKQGDCIGHKVGDKPYAIRCYLSAGNRQTIDRVTDDLFRSVKVFNTEGDSMLYRNVRTDYGRAGR